MYRMRLRGQALSTQPQATTKRPQLGQFSSTLRRPAFVSEQPSSKLKALASNSIDGQCDKRVQDANKILTQPERARFILARYLTAFEGSSLPSTTQLALAHDYFREGSTSLVYSSAKFRILPFNSLPEVAFLGRSNVGKSSLLNAITSSKICHTSSNPGRTRTMNAFSIRARSENKAGAFHILDMPGYGFRSQQEWGEEIVKYLERRKSLKRVFVIVDSIHWLKSTDIEILQYLCNQKIPYEVVLSKIDKLLFPEEIKAPLTKEKLGRRLAVVEREVKWAQQKLRNMTELRDYDDTNLEKNSQLIACAASAGRWKNLGQGKDGALGMDTLRWAVLQAVGVV